MSCRRSVGVRLSPGAAAPVGETGGEFTETLTLAIMAVAVPGHSNVRFMGGFLLF